MKATSLLALLGCAVLSVCLEAGLFAQDVKAAEAKVRALPKPVTEGGKPLMEALKLRHTDREFSAKKLPDQVLSNLLWAADGITRPDGKRTAPSAVNWQEIDVYVAMADGLWLYDAKAHALTQVLTDDLRALTGKQAFVKDAPVNLVFVADLSKMKMPGITDDDKKIWAAADTGFISQNVYLFCASEGLSTVVRGLIDKPALAKAMNLRADQSISLAQTVGYPAETERAAKPAFKGMELYSFKPEGKGWQFNLLGGTNGLKTEAQVTNPETSIDGVEKLKAELSKLAKGELLVWKNLAKEPLPDADRKDLETLCKTLDVKFYEMGHDILR